MVLEHTYLNVVRRHLVRVADDVTSSIRLLSLKLLVGSWRQATLREGKQHLRRSVHRHDYGVIVASSESRADLLDVVKALSRTTSTRSIHMLSIVALLHIL